MADWIKTTDRLPEKPGKQSYEHIDCWIFVDGYVMQRPWNCKHQCWDDLEYDDFEYEATKPTHWMLLDRPSPPKAG